MLKHGVVAMVNLQQIFNMIQPRQHIKLLQIHLDPRGFLQVFLHPSLEQQSFSNLQAPDEEQRPAEALAPPAEDGLEILDGRTQRVQL